jgi:hypothetical protein
MILLKRKSSRPQRKKESQRVSGLSRKSSACSERRVKANNLAMPSPRVFRQVSALDFQKIELNF